jgi:signal transduction histidine kinase/ActR/RegA family two-component response regulator
VVGVTFKVRVARRLASIAGHLQRTADRPASARIAPIRVLGDDEIGVLARSFNVLAERLNAAHEEMDARVHERTAQLASANDALQRENVQRKLAEEKLRESADLMRAQNEELEAQKQQMIAQQEELKAVNHELEAANAAVQAASRAKSEFLANMSHEIRTPMTAITGYTDLLLDSFCGAHECSGHACSRREECPVQSEAGQHLVTIRRNSDHLLQIIDDILDLSKVEAGKLSVESVECSPVALMEETRSLLQVRADAKKLALRVEADGPVPDRILSDPRRIKQILLNLVGNALKFTGSGGVDVRCRFRAGPEPRLIFEIRDTGIGLSGEQISRLFQPFTQVDASASRQFGGSGLGLAISRRLSEILGGGITVESEPGKGSTFRASIAAPLPEGAALVEPCPAGPDARAISAGPPRLNCRILLAEDGPDNQKLISHVLRRAGAEVTISDNGESAVFAAMEAAMKGEPFDIILMDMQMPVLDGYGATATLRRKGYQRPIIALTAHAMAGDRHKCLDAGCDDYATKPIDRQALFTTITRYLPVAARPSARAV